MSNPGDRQDPLPSFCFVIEIPGVQAFFKSVSGLKSETEVVQVKEGGANSTTFNLVGATKWAPIVLKNGFTADSKLLTWREDWATGRSMKRQSGVITQLDTALRPMGRWTFVRGWPSKWEIGEFDAAKSELSIETLEIVHEGLSYRAVARPAPPAPSKAKAQQPRPPAAAPPTTPPTPSELGRAPTQEELISLNKARFADIEEVEELERRHREQREQAKPPVRTPEEEAIIERGKARFPDVE
ncbi:MAG: phage tail protein [Deltaproteobacteria bacterium]|nr:phage tail protein [Deltaproteobacteria bacterium]